MDSELLSAFKFANPSGFCLGSDVYDGWFLSAAVGVASRREGLRLRIPRRLKLLRSPMQYLEV
ncbi:hypothetical protein [Nostoc sp.]|uniref:hypothetical protein n=1 Tax=Nostoc sp. TaxID=1180 RepID=UPI002FFB2B03